jgi:hypothetical protein
MKGLSSSDLKMLAKSFREWEAYKSDKKESDSMALGTLFHEKILEPGKNEIIVKPKVNLASKAGVIELIEFYCKALDYDEGVSLVRESAKIAELKDTLSTLENDLKDHDFSIVDQEVADKLNRMEESLYSHPESGILDLESPEIEVESTYVFELKGKLGPLFDGLEGSDMVFKVRPDYLNHGAFISYVIDLKSCKDSSPRGFERAVWQYGYHISAAFYMDVLNACGVPVEEFFLIAVQNQGGYTTEIYKLSDKMLKAGRDEYMKGINNYIRRESQYGGYSQGEIMTIGL